MQDIILHWFADVEKQNAKGALEKRSAMITDRALYLFFVARGKANITRCIAIHLITKLVVQGDWINIHVPSEYDVRVRPPSADSLQEGIRILQVIHRCTTGNTLEAVQGDEDVRSLKMKKPAGWNVTILPLRTKKSLVHALARAQSNAPTETVEEIALQPAPSESEMEGPTSEPVIGSVSNSGNGGRTVSPVRPRPLELLVASNKPLKSPERPVRQVSPTRSPRNKSPGMMQQRAHNVEPVSSGRVQQLEAVIEGLLTELADLRYLTRDQLEQSCDSTELAEAAYQQFILGVTTRPQSQVPVLSPKNSIELALQEKIAQLDGALLKLAKTAGVQAPTPGDIVDAVAEEIRCAKEREAQALQALDQLKATQPNIEFSLAEAKDAQKEVAVLLGDQPASNWKELLEKLSARLKEERAVPLAAHTERALAQLPQEPRKHLVSTGVQPLPPPERVSVACVTDHSDSPQVARAQPSVDPANIVGADERLEALLQQQASLRTELESTRHKHNQCLDQLDLLRSQSNLLTEELRRVQADCASATLSAEEAQLALTRANAAAAAASAWREAQGVDPSSFAAVALQLTESYHRQVLSLQYGHLWTDLCRAAVLHWTGATSQGARWRTFANHWKRRLQVVSTALERQQMRGEDPLDPEKALVVQLQAMHHRACEALTLERRRSAKLQEQLTQLSTRYHDLCSSVKTEMQSQITDLTGQIKGLQREVRTGGSPQRPAAAAASAAPAARSAPGSAAERLERWNTLGERLLRSPDPAAHYLTHTPRTAASYGRASSPEVLHAMEALRIARQLGT